MTDKAGQSRPEFAPGIVVSEPSFIVDRDGGAWWVHPGSMVIFPVVLLDNPEIKLRARGF